MTTIIVSLRGRSVELRLPSDWEHDVQLLFGVSAPSVVEPCTYLTVAADDDGRMRCAQLRQSRAAQACAIAGTEDAGLKANPV